jgi:hypothetical protein
VEATLTLEYAVAQTAFPNHCSRPRHLEESGEHSSCPLKMLCNINICQNCGFCMQSATDDFYTHTR